MIEVKNLVKYYGGFKAIDNINFSVNKGEILGFLGPNGAGKTTTMRVITGALIPTSGSVNVAGYDVARSPMQIKGMIGYLPENPPLYNDMTVASYLAYVAELKGVEKKRISTSVNKVLDVCDIGDERNRLIGNLSKGFKQRTGMAQALVHDPKILVLDEPTSGLDPKQIIGMRKLIRSLQGERTVILSSHILPEIQMTCERVIILNKGKIVAIDQKDNLSRHIEGNNSYEITLSKVDEELIGLIRDFDGVLDVGLVPGKDNSIYIDTQCKSDIRAQLIKGMVSRNYDVLEFRNKNVSLEDVFLKLTTEEAENR